MSDAALAPKGFRLSSREERRRQRDLIAPSVQQLLHNDKISQKRIIALEEWRKAREALTFWQRIAWLVRGR